MAMPDNTPSPGSPAPASSALLLEIAWEVCQQLGGIYTVVRTKAPSMLAQWGNNYCLVGPYNPQLSPAEFEPTPPTGPFGELALAMQERGYEVHYGVWLTTGRPQVILLNPHCVYNRLHEIKYFLWRDHELVLPAHDTLLDPVVAVGFLVQEMLRVFCEQQAGKQKIVAHFHEWMAASAIAPISKLKLPVATVFTTHATMLGRYLAMHDPWFYDHVPFFDWLKEARHFNIEPQVRLERAAAQHAGVFTTLSEITAFECEHLLGRKPDMLLPNGINIERFVALHEFQNLHRVYKEKIHKFVMSHFFPCYSFDLDKTVYFFTSGRYEYRNKGFDMTIESLARLNARMKAEKVDRTVVFFLISRQPCKSINAAVLSSRAMMEELRANSERITEQIHERLFVQVAAGQLPSLDSLVDDHMKLRLRRMMHAWRNKRLPPIITHDLVDDQRDEVLGKLRACQLFNAPEDPVKVVYHPDFINPTNPLFGMDYDQFVRGCHLGIFPSAYEPWGYTPLECVARGIPAITSDLAGFGTYIQETMADHGEKGLFVVHRRKRSFEEATNDMTDWMLQLVKLGRRERITMRNAVESGAAAFDWDILAKHYFAAEYRAAQLAGG